MFSKPSPPAPTGAENSFSIQARNLSKTYAVFEQPRDRLKQLIWRGRRRFGVEFHALSGVSIDIQRGETMAVVGRNGSGKSTLVRLIAGTLAPSSGELRICGSVAPILTLGAGFNPDFTGRENAQLNAAILGLDDSEIESRLPSIASFADIGDFFDRPVRLYSSGMYSRLAFAVAVHVDPDVLVVDETLAVGDEAFARKCFARIDAIKRRGSTILFVSHSASHVIDLADRVLLLEGGERLLVGHPKEVMDWYHRLLYAAPVERAEVVSAIRSIDSAAPQEAAEQRMVSAARLESRRRETAQRESSGRFDSALKSESRMEYMPRGARISDPRILDREGRTVNVLRADQVYRYAYEVRFERPVFFVRFGLMIKSVTGIELGGQVSHVAGEGVSVAADSVARVLFCFRPRFAPGIYFFNAGVIDANGMFLHRIIDAVAFRVESDGRSTVTGFVDLSEEQEPRVTLEAGLPRSSANVPSAHEAPVSVPKLDSSEPSRS